MKSIIQQITEQYRLSENKEAAAVKAEINDPKTGNSRRNFLKKTAMGGIALGGLMSMSFEIQ